mmetsp:Transcript_685/g.1808  ORF Transcript_685/g.1808 Transcript_685/m.1808 type:complete len:248 (+) Transcript_685:1680-2423(+)
MIRRAPLQGGRLLQNCFSVALLLRKDNSSVFDDNILWVALHALKRPRVRQKRLLPVRSPRLNGPVGSLLTFIVQPVQFHWAARLVLEDDEGGLFRARAPHQPRATSVVVLVRRRGAMVHASRVSVRAQKEEPGVAVAHVDAKSTRKRAQTVSPPKVLPRKPGPTTKVSRYFEPSHPTIPSLHSPAQSAPANLSETDAGAGDSPLLALGGLRARTPSQPPLLRKRHNSLADLPIKQLGRAKQPFAPSR